jgi:hypothetical protein
MSQLGQPEKSGAYNPQVGFTPNFRHGLAPREVTLCAIRKLGQRASAEHSN